MALILVMGIPASGKSTWRRRIQETHPELIESTSFDEFRGQLRSAQQLTDENAHQLRKAFQRHVESHIAQCGNSKIYIIEDIFYFKSMRRPFQKMARRRGFQFGVVHLHIGTLEALRRNSERVGEEKLKNETIWNVVEKMEMPDAVAENMVAFEQDDEGRADLEHLLKMLKIHKEFLKSGETMEVLTMEDIVDASGKPDHAMAPPSKSSQSTLEFLDVFTRRLVSEIMQNDRSIDGRKLSQARKQLLNTLSETIADSDLICNTTDKNRLKLKLFDIFNEL